MYNVLTNDDNIKLGIVAKNLLEINETEKNNKIELKEKYINGIDRQRREYDEKVQKYMEEYKKAKTMIEKVNIKPPIKENESNIFTYTTQIEVEDKEDEFKIDRLNGKFVSYGDRFYLFNMCNVTGKVPKGLVKEIFDKYPEANIYDKKRKLGDIIVKSNIINAITQVSPLKAKEPNDSEEIRLNAFEETLNKIGKKYNDISIVFNEISKEYNEKIEEFGRKNRNIKVYIV